MRQSLIFIASHEGHRIVPESIVDKKLWDTEFEATAGFWWYKDPQTENLFVHGYHPKYMRLQRFFDEAIDQTVKLTKRKLPAFGG